MGIKEVEHRIYFYFTRKLNTGMLSIEIIEKFIKM